MDPDAPAPVSAPRKGPRILVVSPNRSHLALLARRLGEEGYRIVAAESGAKALTELGRTGADLVLSELVMEPMSGTDLTRAIRGEAAWRDLPIMLISGRSEPNGAVRAYEAGADDVILKPFHFEVLAAKIDRRLTSARTLQSLREDMATMDARAALRAIELGELRDRFFASEAQRRKLVGA